MRPKTKRDGKLISGIDSTALVSVLLAILFLLMGPSFLTDVNQKGPSADLPKVRHPISMRGAHREDAIIIVVQMDGKIYSQHTQLDPSELAQIIRLQLASGAEKKVYIRGDARARYRDVREVLDGVRAAGIENVAFLVDEGQPRFR